MATAKATNKPISEDAPKAKGNIENLGALRKEFQKNVMVPRKLVMLKARLVELYSKKTITDEEQELLMLILKKERARSIAPEGSYEVQVINQIEKSRCVQKCRAKDDQRIQLINKDQVYSFHHDTDSDRYFVYIDHLIKAEWQKSKELIGKEERGHFPPQSEYPVDRYDIKRIDINERFFNAWFEVEEDLLSETQEDKEESYTF